MNEEPLEPPPAPWASSPIEDAASPRRSRRRRVAGLLGIVAVALLVVGGVATALVTTGRLGRPAPAEPRVALVDPDGALATVNASGGNRTVHAAPGTQFTFPAWSPDGTRIAALATTGDTVAVRVYDTRPNASADGTVLYASSDAPPFYLYWTPDSRAVTFLTATGPDIALRSAPADASAEATVVREGAPMYWAWEAPDRMLVHAGAADSAFLGSMRPDGTTISPIAGSMGDFRAPAASGDGHYEAFLLAKPDGGGAVVAATADGGSRHEAAVFGSAAFGFGPSGSRLAFVAADSADRVAPFRWARCASWTPRRAPSSRSRPPRSSPSSGHRTAGASPRSACNRPPIRARRGALGSPRSGRKRRMRARTPPPRGCRSVSSSSTSTPGRRRHSRPSTCRPCS